MKQNGVPECIHCPLSSSTKSALGEKIVRALWKKSSCAAAFPPSIALELKMYVCPISAKTSKFLLIA